MKLLTFTVVLALAACASCTDKSDKSDKSESGQGSSVTQVTEPSDAIDQKLMVALSQAKNFHHKAKVYMSDGNTAAAIASVREILSLRFPPNAPEADDVRNDARALLARLLVGEGQLDEAMNVVKEGLSSPRESFFTANLYTVKGEIHEARAQALDKSDVATDKAKAVEERHAAIESFDASNKIDKKLQDQLLEQR
jgi:predicted negative regulator of RcsB-dependent stress response